MPTAQYTKKGKQRQDSNEPVNYWRLHDVDPVEFGRDDWKIIALRGERPLERADVTDFVESFTWDDAGGGTAMQGTVNFRKPPGARFNLGEGHQLVLYWRRRDARNWRWVWTMRISGPTDAQGLALDVKAGTYQAALADDLSLLAKGGSPPGEPQGKGVTFKIKKDKTHPKGWRIDHAIVEFCRQHGIPLWPVPQMRHYTKSFTMTASPLTILIALRNQENENEGAMFRFRWDNGRIRFYTLQRSRYLLHLAGTILEATLTQGRKTTFATRLHVKATAKVEKGKDSKGKKKRKRNAIEVTVRSDPYERRYGRIERTITVTANSRDEALRKGRRRLSRILEPRRELEFTHPGVPFLRQLDAMVVSLPQEGFRELCYVNAVSHNVTAGDYTMRVTVRFTDLIAREERKAARRRKAAAKRRARKAPKKDDAQPATTTTTSSTGGSSDDDGGARTAPQPKKAPQRRDRPQPIDYSAQNRKNQIELGRRGRGPAPRPLVVPEPGDRNPLIPGRQPGPLEDPFNPPVPA